MIMKGARAVDKDATSQEVRKRGMRRAQNTRVVRWGRCDGDDSRAEKERELLLVVVVVEEMVGREITCMGTIMRQRQDVMSRKKGFEEYRRSLEERVLSLRVAGAASAVRRNNSKPCSTGSHALTCRTCLSLLLLFFFFFRPPALSSCRNDSLYNQ